jgi:hypothetical protein
MTKGNIIPPSQRFKAETPDIRYQMGEKTTPSKVEKPEKVSSEEFIKQFRKPSLIPAELAKRMLTDQAPEYLKEVGILFSVTQEVFRRTMTVRDIAKAYIITLSSINARAIQVSTFEANTGLKVPLYATGVIKRQATG